MPKTARKSRNKRKISSQINSQVTGIPSPVSSPLKPVSMAPAKTQPLSYDAMGYIKNDIKWTFITTLIVVVILVILYIFFR